MSLFFFPNFEGIGRGWTNQFRVSGETVLSRYFDLVHDLHEAFSRRELLLYTFRLATICLQDDHMSSSLQLCER